MPNSRSNIVSERSFDHSRMKKISSSCSNMNECNIMELLQRLLASQGIASSVKPASKSFNFLSIQYKSSHLSLLVLQDIMDTVIMDTVGMVEADVIHVTRMVTLMGIRTAMENKYIGGRC